MFEHSVSRRTFLRTSSAALLAAPLAHVQSLRAQSARPPNVILILCDDLGYGDLHSYGSQIPTPHLDRMAEEGVRFSQFYSASNVCSPSRAALLTGRYQTRVGVPDVLAPTSTTGLNASEKTIAEILKPAGYKTMCVGKWHVGSQQQYLPTARGFDKYYGIPYSNDQLPSLLMQNTTTIESPVQLDTLTSRYTDQATGFIEASGNNPFFLYMAHTFPHIPLAVSTKFKGTSGLGMYGDVISELDWSVGQVLASVKANGLDNDTLVIFTSDNGPWYQGSAGRLRGRKGWSYEGGVREPFIARFPGRIPAQRLGGKFSVAGRVIDGMATTMDLMPTIANLAGAQLPSAPLDGMDIWPLLTGSQQSLDREVFLYFDSWYLQCARLGPWKLHFSRYNDYAYSPDPIGGRMNLPLVTPELYNLETDPDESYNVAPDNMSVVADIQARVLKMLPSFPPQVLAAWNWTMQQPVYGTADGALPVSAAPPQ
jgi:arylsulfatase A